MLHVICTRLRPGHLSVHVGDSPRRCEEIVKKKKNRMAPLNAIINIIIIIPRKIRVIQEKDKCNLLELKNAWPNSNRNDKWKQVFPHKAKGVTQSDKCSPPTAIG